MCRYRRCRSLFTNFLVSSPTCSPSRPALLTGSYPVRVGIPNVLFPHHNIGLAPEEITIAELLKEKGYATAVFGKWHLGHHPEHLPLSHGFDEYFGIPYSNDMTPDVSKNPNPAAQRHPPIPLVEQLEVIETRPAPPNGLAVAARWILAYPDRPAVSGHPFRRAPEQSRTTYGGPLSGSIRKVRRQGP